MSAGSYTVALEVSVDGREQYMLRGPDGERLQGAPATPAHKRKLDQDAANRNRMARERRKEPQP